MSDYIKPLRKNICSSRYALNTNAFDTVNTPSGSFRLTPNTTITVDTPMGVLGGSIGFQSGDWEANLSNNTKYPLGLFAGNSEGNAFENAPAIASGVVPVYYGGGDFLVYVFETNAQDGGAAKTLSTAYAVNTPLYTSYFALLTNDLPSGASTPGINNIVAIVSKAPSSTDLEMGIRLMI